MDVSPSLDTVQEVVLMFGIGKTIWFLVHILLQDTLTATPSVGSVQEPEEQVVMKKICILTIKKTPLIWIALYSPWILKSWYFRCKCWLSKEPLYLSVLWVLWGYHHHDHDTCQVTTACWLNISSKPFLSNTRPHGLFSGQCNNYHQDNISEHWRDDCSEYLLILWYVF